MTEEKTNPGSKKRKAPVILMIVFGILFVFIICAGVIAVSIPNLLQSRGSSDLHVCQSNLKQIGLALIMYASDHGGMFPPDLKTLQDKNYIVFDGKALSCPTNGDSLTLNDVIEDYNYIPGLSYDHPTPSTVILIEERVGNHDNDYVNILYLDGHVESYKTSDANR